MNVVEENEKWRGWGDETSIGLEPRGLHGRTRARRTQHMRTDGWSWAPEAVDITPSSPTHNQWEYIVVSLSGVNVAPSLFTCCINTRDVIKHDTFRPPGLHAVTHDLLRYITDDSIRR